VCNMARRIAFGVSDRSTLGANRDRIERVFTWEIFCD
jgi:hypothetical protein